MKIWYQAYNTSARVDPKWRYYEEACERYIVKVARPDTQIHFAWLEKRAPKMLLSKYIQYMHLAEVIECAFEAERQGYDAFVLGGMRDLGHAELREALDIPVIFIGEVAYHMACMMAPRFSVIHNDEAALRAAGNIINSYGLGSRYIPGVQLGYSQVDIMEAFETKPEKVAEEIKTAARVLINQGAAILIPGFAAISVFLDERGIRDIDGVPVLDCQSAAIKVAEMQVDMRRLGMCKPRLGSLYDVSKKDIQTARKIYGLE